MKWSNIALNLLALRKAHKLTVRQMAAMLDVSPSTVCQWEKGGREPRKNAREKICQVFQIEEHKLFQQAI